MTTRLRDLRRRKLMTQKELADAVGSTYQTVQRWESGESTPRPSALRQLCAVLDVTPDELLAALGSKDAEGKELAAA